MNTNTAAPPGLVVIGADELPVLRGLMELYLYDFSEFIETDVRPNGRFLNEKKWEAELARKGVERFLLKAGEAWSGFAIVAHESWIDGRAGVHDMDEFFVLRRHRRRGLGQWLATRMFERFPGDWEVRVLSENAPAYAFWRRVIDQFTSGRFTEQLLDTPRWQGHMLAFQHCPK